MSLPEGVRRFALVVEYDGSQYQGFQRQASAKKTVQGELERALSLIAAQPVTLVCAGRTDAGVHATHQVVHFDCSAPRAEKAWLDGTNTKLPDSIRVKWAAQVPGEFHARFSALARTYRYFTYISKVRSAFLPVSATWSRDDLDVEAMQEAARRLVGEHDFSSFRSSQCQAHSPVRRIDYIRFVRQGDFIGMEIKANAFLHHMVRNIMGCLFEIGRAARPAEWLDELLTARDRRLAAPTAHPHGLYLVGVDYPAEFGIPAGSAHKGMFGFSEADFTNLKVD
ncbi:tRNA pseudouridine(38-40) synthase TruA [Saccharophagus sp. K07]|uniref:tRNA pseudouridine(38-40) synthase TruA n=1 Tax=Saccharophagus sp. K07 TaxID=2283636 RepID=UPI002103F121|nr:tRNA pseudouridine(38-40) synthase TruA [Saccharophagus sp. K07]